jgi:hypothetical protein
LWKACYAAALSVPYVHNLAAKEEGLEMPEAVAKHARALADAMVREASAAGVEDT